MRIAIGLALLFCTSSVAWAKAPARTTSSGQAERWPDRSVHVTLDPSLSALGPNAMDDVRAAFGTWLGADVGPRLPKFVFEIGTTPGAAAKDGVVRVLATKDVARGHEKDVAYTVSWADVSTGTIVESDIVFNLAYAFDTSSSSSTACSNTWDTRSVATHEVGHFLGLAEDMADETTTMWFRTSPCDTHKAQLGKDDVAAIEALYTTTSDARTVTAQSCSTGGGPVGSFWILAPIVAVYMRRKRRS